MVMAVASPARCSAAQDLPSTAMAGANTISTCCMARISTAPRAGHGLSQGTHEVLAAVGDPRGAKEDALQRSDGADLDARATRQRRRWCRHAPIGAGRAPPRPVPAASPASTRRHRRRWPWPAPRPGACRRRRPPARSGRCARSAASRAAATSAMAVTCGTPMPSTSRVVHAAPGPTPTKMAAMPCSMSWRPPRTTSCCRPPRGCP